MLGISWARHGGSSRTVAIALVGAAAAVTITVLVINANGMALDGQHTIQRATAAW
ncbi:hypothetical protein [Aquamicrobium soli]|uniref:Flp pilus-assembly TadG-like N-terminal domain-containing protein n=1 Tax=Aquamicrobium soli TaxID=1811518 RepID=A0ABV7KCS2_9HYPH